MSLAIAQNKQISGTVTEETGEPLIGASVIAKGTSIGTVTDIDGKFSFSVPGNVSTVVVRYLGYAEAEAPASANVRVILKADTKVLDEVLVVAFGTTKKSAFTGSAAVINAEDLSKHITTNVANALVGSVSGLQMRGSSGAPGAGSGSINIRGISSMYASTDPLIIVDGAPYSASLSNIPQGDVESMTVLKDAASAALYGSRGASGVIIVTTKRGKTQNAVINVDVKYGTNTRAVQDYDVITDPAQYYEAYYSQLYNQYYYGQGNDVATANSRANTRMISDLGYNVYTLPEGQLLVGEDGKLNPRATLGRKYTYNGTEYYMQPDNWQDMAYKTALRQEYNVSINSGSDRSSFYASIGYLNEDGIIEYSSYNRLSARLKADYQVKKWLKVGGNAGYVHSNQKSNPNLDTSLSSTNLGYYTSMIAPIYPVFIRVVDEAGNVVIKKDERGHEAYDYGVAATNYGVGRAFLQTGNPLGSNRYNDVSNEGNQLNANFTADVYFTDFLKFNATSTVIWGQTNNSDYQNPFYGPKVGVNGELTKQSTSALRTNNVQSLTYFQDFGGHNVNVMAGHEYYKTKTKYLDAIAQGGFSPDIQEINAFANPTNSHSYSTAYNVEGYFGSAQYNYVEKYFVSASYRRDASSYFEKDHRWGDFWSVGAAWLISKEKFMPELKWLDQLKIKASIGQQGNDGIGSWYYTDLYSLSKASETAMSPTFSRIGNPDITWETTTNFNAGLEFSLWQGRLSGNVDVYNKKTTDLLFWLSIPESAGVRGYYGNVGDIRNQGVELGLTGAIIRTKDIDWSVSANLSHNTSKILSLPESKIADNGGFVESSGGLNKWYEVGRPLYNAFLPKYAGVNEEGLATYWVDADLEGATNKPGKNYSSTTTNPNNASRYALGSVLPAIFGGFSTALRIGNVDVFATFDYQLGGKVYDSRYQNLIGPNETAGGAGSTFHKDYIKSWSPTNTSSNIPRWQYGDQYSVATSDRFLTNAGYLNFQSFNVGYTLPKNLIKDVSKIRIYAAGENLYFWSARKGLDPRYSYNANSMVTPYSPVRNISGGVQVTF
jgi:TonB-linked SusC/RagA family outer membrane protein